MAKCGDCLHFQKCSHYVTPEETFPEVGGCSAFKNKGDFVEVVRCKDCKQWKCHGMPFDITKGTCHNPRFHFHHGHVIDECFMPVTNETDFCSYGERREGE